MDSSLRVVMERDAKVFFWILYAEDTKTWVRRQDCRFAINRNDFINRFKPSGSRKYDWSDRMFQRLQNVGWIYNYRRDKFTIRFSVRIPNWLQLSPYAKVSEKYVPQDRRFGEDESQNVSLGSAKTKDTKAVEKDAWDTLQDELKNWEEGAAVIEDAALKPDFRYPHERT